MLSKILDTVSMVFFYFGNEGFLGIIIVVLALFFLRSMIAGTVTNVFTMLAKAVGAILEILIPITLIIITGAHAYFAYLNKLTLNTTITSSSPTLAPYAPYGYLVPLIADIIVVLFILISFFKKKK